MTSATPGLSVVITTHERRDRLDPLLDRLLADPGAAEVVVVADGCTDGTDELLRARAATDPRVRPVLLHPNVGQPRARAAGVRAATHEVVLSLDDDVLPDPGLASGHAARHARGDVDLVLGYMPTACPRPRRPGQYATEEYAEHYEQAVERWEAAPERVLDGLWGGNLSVLRAAYLAAVDGYDFPLGYHEDAELGLRLRERGCRATFDRSLRAVHQHSRGWEAYLREARSAGSARALLAQRWPEDMPFDEDALLATASLPVRVLARLCRREAVHRLAMLLLSLAVPVLGAARSWRAEDRASRLAKLLEGHRAVRRARAGLTVG